MHNIHRSFASYFAYIIFIWAMIIGAIIAVSAVDQYTVILGNEALAQKAECNEPAIGTHK